MALAVLIVQLIRNRHLNPVWLRALRIITAKAKKDPEYGLRVGSVLAGLTPATDAVAWKVVIGTVQQAVMSTVASTAWTGLGGPKNLGRVARSVAREGIGSVLGSVSDPVELVDWALGVAGGSRRWSLRSIAILFLAWLILL